MTEEPYCHACVWWSGHGDDPFLSVGICYSPDRKYATFKVGWETCEHWAEKSPENIAFKRLRQ